MAIAYRGREYAFNAATTNVDVNKPSGTADGDLLIAFCCTEDTATFSANTGTWNAFADDNAAPSTFGSAAFWRIADDEPSSWNFSCTQTADDFSAVVMVFYNTSGFGTWIKEDQDNETVTATPPQGTVTVDVTSGELVVMHMGCDDDWELNPDPADQGMTRTYYAGVSGEGGEVTTSAISHGAFYQLDASGSTSKNWGFPDTSSEEGDARIGVFSWASVTTYHLTGITKDKDGNVLGSCECFLFKDNGDNTLSFVAYQVSNASTGVYDFTGLQDDDAAYLVYSVKDGSPNRFDVTDHVLQPVEE